MLRSAAIVAATGFLTIASIQPTFAADASTPIVKPATEGVPIKRALDRPLPEVRFSANSFSDCIDFIADATGANIVVDWKALDAAKVTKDTPVTLRLSEKVPLHKVLRLILDQAGGSGVLTYYVDDGVLQITSAEQADKELITRLYPIQDLLFQAPDYNDAPSLSLTNNSSTGSVGGGTGAGGGGGGGSSGGSGMFGGSGGGGGGGGGSSSDPTQTMTREQRADAIIKMITDTVRPELWKINGGNCTISYIRGNLVVTAPRSIHEQLSSQ